MLRNEHALNHLMVNLSDQQGMSSHWRHYHDRFAVNANGSFHVEGIACFTPFVPWKAPLHRLLQRGVLKQGRPFATFPNYIQSVRSIARQWQSQLDLGMIRQALTLAQVEHLVPLGPRFYLVIGDGFGMLGSLILASIPGSRVLFVNLTKSLLLDLYYCQLAIPEIQMALVANEAEMKTAIADTSLRVLALKAGDGNLLAMAPIAMAFNIASMQEMDLSVIRDYFLFMRRVANPVYFYCCNRLEKRLPDGSLIRFMEYPWRSEDDILLDSLCPWTQEYYSLRPPFWHKYEGPVQHRLVQLAPDQAEG